jgi:5'-3' exonuclease
MRQPLYLIDASIYIFRAYFSVPDHWQSPEGYSVNAVYGYTNFLIKVLTQVEPSKIAAAFDESLGTCFRNDIYSGYKSSRALPDESLAFQLEACKVITELLGIACFASDRYEADDLLASLANVAKSSGDNITVISRDKDLGQLLGDGDEWWDFAAGTRLGIAGVVEQFGVKPTQIKDYLALVGDSVDDIPGVLGIGKKTAAKLLQYFDSIERMLSDLAAVEMCDIRGAKRIAQNLDGHREQILMAQQLISLANDIPLVTSYAELQWRKPTKESVSYFLQELGLMPHLRRKFDTISWWQTE